MDFPAPAFRVTSSRDTQGNERETNGEALARGLRVNENTSDQVQQYMQDQEKARWEARAAAFGNDDSRLGITTRKPTRQAQSQTVRPKFHGRDVFERKAELEKPRPVRVFAPLGGEDEKAQERKTGGEERSEEFAGGESSAKHGKGFGKKLGGLFKRDKGSK